MPCFLIQDSVTNVSGHIFSETALVDVTCLGIEHSCIFNIREVYPFADNVYFHDLVGVDLLDLELHCRSWLPFHPVGALLARQSVGGNSIDLHDFVTAAQAVSHGRRTCVRLVDDHVPILVRLVDDCSDASIALAYHHLEVFILLFGDVDGVGVQVSQHGIDSSPFYPVYRKGIDIGAVELLQDCILDFCPFSELEALGLC